METTRKIILHTQEVKNGNQKFTASSAEINGKWYKIKFRQNVLNAPKDKGLYELTLNFDNCSVERGHKYIDRNGDEQVSNPTIWVGYITAIRKFTDEDMRENNRLAMAEIFGSDNDTELPF